MLCLVKPVNARFLSLLNSVKFDSSLISFSASWQVNSFLISANYLYKAVTVFIFYFFGEAVTVSKFQTYLVKQLKIFFAGINSA